MEAPGKVEILDIRRLDSPENVLAVLARVSAGLSGGSLVLRSDSNPFQLYDLLQQRGFNLAMEREADGTYKGTISPRDLAKS